MFVSLEFKNLHLNTYLQSENNYNDSKLNWQFQLKTLYYVNILAFYPNSTVDTYFWDEIDL